MSPNSKGVLAIIAFVSVCSESRISVSADRRLNSYRRIRAYQRRRKALELVSLAREPDGQEVDITFRYTRIYSHYIFGIPAVQSVPTWTLTSTVAAFELFAPFITIVVGVWIKNHRIRVRLNFSVLQSQGSATVKIIFSEKRSIREDLFQNFLGLFRPTEHHAAFQGLLVHAQMETYHLGASPRGVGCPNPQAR